MRTPTALFSVLVLPYGVDARVASAQTPGICTAPDPFAQIGGGTCVNGGWIPPSNPTPPPPKPPIPPSPPTAVVIGEPMTGTITPDSDGEMFFELTAPSDGTLVVHSLGDVASLWIDDVLFDDWPPMIGTLPVVAGRTYLARVVVSFGWWDYDIAGLLPVSFVFATSLIPPGGVVPVGCQGRPPVPNNWVCFNGGWVPPELINPVPPPSLPPTPPSPPPPTTGGCTTSDPFASLGGGTCVDGGWWPPGLLPPAPTPTVPGGCTTADPFVSIGGGVCVNGGWRPR